MNAPRWRLACLWLSQLARVLADNWLRLFVVLELARQWHNHADQAWHLVVLLWTLPMVVLAPFNGALCNSLPKPRVLIMSALAGFAAVLGGLLGVLPWLVCWALVALTFAIYGPTRYAFLPAASQDTGLTLPRLNGLFEMGAAAATVGGVLLAGEFLLMGQPHEEAFALLSVTTFAVLALNMVTVAFALPVRFAGDVYRPDGVLTAVAGFFKDCGRIWHVPKTRGCLLGLALLRAIILAFTGAVLEKKDLLGADDGTGNLAGQVEEMVKLILWLGLGVAVGSYLASLCRHPVRTLGLVPWGATGFAFSLGLVALDMHVGPVLCLALGFTFSFINVPLAATYQAGLPADARGNGMAARNFCDYAVTTVLAGILFALTKWAHWSPQSQFWLLTGLAVILAGMAWRSYYPEFFELLWEWMMVPCYRISATGPGLASFPRDGPVVVIANHSSWIDPFWLGKMVPRRFVPMMTSRFYDLPIVRWLMVNVVGAIRIQEARFRRDIPELREAIASLDLGRVVLIFPEGGLRRHEERPLRFFGQGVWHILAERPATPVVVCWIEGGWGSFFSMAKGPPMKNKPFDIRRPIRIALAAPLVVPEDILTDQRSTRSYLMEQCLLARQILGLPAISVERTREDGD